MTLPVPTQRTWATGDIVTAAMMNANVRDAVNYLANEPLFIGTDSVVANFSTGNWLAQPFDTNTVDTYSGHSTVTNNTRYTAQVAGWYLLTFRSAWASNATGVRAAAFSTPNTSTVDVSTAVQIPAASSGVTIVQTTGRKFLNVGDYVQFLGFQNSGGTLATVAGDCEASAQWVHA